MNLYLEPVLREAIIQSLKGWAADLVRYLGPEARVKEVLDKLQMHDAILSEYHLLKNQFHLTHQENSERVSAFCNQD